MFTPPSKDKCNEYPSGRKFISVEKKYSPSEMLPGISSKISILSLVVICATVNSCKKPATSISILSNTLNVDKKDVPLPVICLLPDVPVIVPGPWIFLIIFCVTSSCSPLGDVISIAKLFLADNSEGARRIVSLSIAITNKAL